MKYFCVLICLTLFLFNDDALKAIECTTMLYHRPESLLVTPAQAVGVKSNDLIVVQRLVNAYRATGRRYQNLGSAMWQMFFNTRHGPLHYIFIKGTVEEAAYILRNPHCSELFYGFDMLAAQWCQFKH